MAPAPPAREPNAPIPGLRTMAVVRWALLGTVALTTLATWWLLLRGRIRPEAQHPVSRAIRRIYEPFVMVALHHPRTTVLIGLFALLSALPLRRARRC